MSFIESRVPDEEVLGESILPEAWAFVGLWLIWFLWFYRLWPFWDDHAVYHVMAASWLHGGRPYVDATDPNWPGALLLHVVAFLLSGYAPWGIRLLDTVLQAWLAVTTLRLLHAWGVRREWRVLSVTLFAVTYLSGTFGTAAQRECLALPFLIYGLLPWLVPQDWACALSWRKVFFCHGICLGMAVCIKPPLGLAMIVVGLGSLLIGALPWREWARLVGVSAASGFLFLGLVGLLLWRSGGLEGFCQWGVRFAFTDYQLEPEPWGERFTYTGKWLFGVGLLTTVNLIAALYFSARYGRGVGRLIIMALCLCLGLWASAVMQGKSNCLYHFIPFLYSIALLVPAVWNNAETPLLKRWRPWIFGGVGLLLVAYSLIFSLKPVTPTSGYTLGLELREKLKPEENVLIIGFAPTMYLSLERTPPYPLVNSMLFYLHKPEAMDHEIDGLISLLSDTKIRFFMVDSIAYQTKFPFMRVDRCPRVAAYLQEHFSPPVIHEVRGNPLEFAEPVEYLIYERKSL